MVDDEGAGILMMRGIYLSASTLDRPLSVLETIMGKAPRKPDPDGIPSSLS